MQSRKAFLRKWDFIRNLNKRSHEENFPGNCPSPDWDDLECWKDRSMTGVPPAQRALERERALEEEENKNGEVSRD